MAELSLDWARSTVRVSETLNSSVLPPMDLNQEMLRL